jgi:hypothetical protein
VLYEKRDEQQIKESNMKSITDVMDKIEKVREEVTRSLENEPFEVAYAKNRELDGLIEQYLDLLEEPPTSSHLSPPPVTTME